MSFRRWLVVGVLVGAVGALETTVAASDAWAASLAAASLALAWPRAAGRRALVIVACAAAMAAQASAARDRVLDAPLVRVADDGARDGPSAAARTVPPVPIRGVLVEDAAATPAGVRLLIDVREVRTADGWRAVGGRLQAHVGGALAAPHVSAWTRGRRIEAPVLLRRQYPFRNPGSPDPDRQALGRRVVVAGTIKSAALVAIAPGPWWHEAGARVRRHVRAQANRWIAPVDPLSAAVVTAILIGDRAGLPESVTRRLQAAGTYHVIAISGGNVALMVLLSLGLARLTVRSLRARLSVAIGLVMAYGWVVGDDPSVSRAVTGACVYLLCRSAGLKPAPIDILGFVVLIVLAADPLLAIDVGAWLSFGAAFGILHLAGRFTAWATSQERRVALDTPVPRAAIALFSATLAAELTLLPVHASIFTRVGIAGLLLNFVAIPAMAVAQLAGLAVMLAGTWWEGAARCSGWLAHAGVAALVRSAALVEVVPWLSWRVPPPGPCLVLAFYGAWALALAGPMRRSYRRLAAGLALLITIAILTAPGVEAAAPQRGWLRATLLDVGQGEAVLVQFPSGQSLLVDAGGVAGSFDIGGRVVVPALWALGVRRLDWLAVTHTDLDHAGGAVAAAEVLAPREIWEGIPVPPDPQRQALFEHAAAHGIVWRQLQRGDRLEVGGVELAVLHPEPPDWERQRVRNDDSLVLRVRYGTVELWLTGDISRVIEAGLPSGEAGRPHLRVLKVAHHGSRTSTSADLLAAAPPHVALISAGRQNLFGHPAPEVTARLARTGAAIFRTDRDGAIQVETDGRALRVRTMTRGWRGFSLWPLKAAADDASSAPGAAAAIVREP